MRSADVVVVGAGHAGLAMSHELGRRGIDHVLLERGEVAHSWRTQRWDSLRLLTPNWMTRLPGCRYPGDDPDGYMSATEVAGFIAAYARRLSAPLHTHTTVSAVEAEGDGYRVATDRGDWRCRAVVLASGAFGRPVVPKLSAQLPGGVAQLTAASYRHPAQLDAGGVLVVGASATGVQLAQEIQRSGRPVTLAVGEHVRLPRVYRGRDVQWWMLASGVLDQRIEDADEPERARRVPSPQLAGTPGRATLDLNALRAEGVELVGRLAGVRDGRAQFSGSLRNVCALADLKMNRLLDGIDEWAQRGGLDGMAPEAQRYAPTEVGESPRLGLALGSDVRTVIWATGFRPDFGWLRLPVFGRDGSLQHDRGVVAPGLVALGLPFLRRRKSSFIHGAEDDVRELGAHLATHLEGLAARDRPASCRQGAGVRAGVGAAPGAAGSSVFTSGPAAAPPSAPATAPTVPPTTVPTGPATTVPMAAPAAAPTIMPPPVSTELPSRSASPGSIGLCAAGSGSCEGMPWPGRACSTMSSSTADAFGGGLVRVFM